MLCPLLHFFESLWGKPILSQGSPNPKVILLRGLQSALPRGSMHRDRGLSGAVKPISGIPETRQNIAVIIQL